MNLRTALILIVLFAFSVLSGYAVMDVGYMGIFDAGLINSGTLQIFTDLVIACLLACLWMYHDARTRGVNPWPFIVLTLFAGSFGPLLFLLRREWGRTL